MQWIKASEKIPPIGSHIPVKANDSIYGATVYDESTSKEPNKISIFFNGRHHFKAEFSSIEWLDESESPTLTGSVEEQALAYLNDNRKPTYLPSDIENAYVAGASSTIAKNAQVGQSVLIKEDKQENIYYEAPGHKIRLNGIIESLQSFPLYTNADDWGKEMLLKIIGGWCAMMIDKHMSQQSISLSIVEELERLNPFVSYLSKSDQYKSVGFNECLRKLRELLKDQQPPVPGSASKEASMSVEEECKKSLQEHLVKLRASSASIDLKRDRERTFGFNAGFTAGAEYAQQFQQPHVKDVHLKKMIDILSLVDKYSKGVGDVKCANHVYNEIREHLAKHAEE